MTKQLENLALESVKPINLNSKSEEGITEYFSSMFDLIYTPSSMVRYIRDNPSKSKASNYFGYGAASIVELFRGALYITFATVSPVIPLSFITLGLFGYLLNKNKKSKKLKRRR